LFTGVLQAWFIFRPIRHKADFQFQFDVPFQEVWLEGHKGGKLHGVHFRTQASQRKGIVLFFHGNSASVDAWGEVYHDFLPNGWDVFLMDYRGYGKSRGRRSEEIFYQDARQAWTHVHREFPAQQIIIYGRSLGTAMATALGRLVEPRHVVLETPFFSMVDLFYTYYPFLPKWFFFRYRFPNGRHLEDIAAPVTVFHGTKDRVVPYKCGLKLKKYMKDVDQFVTIFDGGHNDLGKFKTYRDHLQEILR
jgi:hypothetical protein